MIDNQHQKGEHSRIRIKDIKKFKPLYNLVLCKPIPYETTTKAGIILNAMDFDQYLSKHVTRKFEVIRPPKELSHKGLPTAFNRPMQWITDMNIKKGDIIWCTAHNGATYTVVEHDGEDYALVHYEEIFLAQRNCDIIPLNGWVICKPFIESYTYLEYKVDKKHPLYLIVLHKGKKNKGYLRPRKDKMEIFDWDIEHDFKAGDVIIKEDEKWGTPLEGGLHNTFLEDDTNAVCIQSRHIVGILEN